MSSQKLVEQAGRPFIRVAGSVGHVPEDAAFQEMM